MTYAVAATWQSLPGHEAEVIAILGELTRATRNELGNQYYQATQGIENPAVFLLFEIYDDEDAYAAHAESEHFQRLAVDDAIPNHLADRVRTFYTPLEGPAS